MQNILKHLHQPIFIIYLTQMEALSGHDKVRTSIPSAGRSGGVLTCFPFSRIFSNNILNKTRQKS